MLKKIHNGDVCLVSTPFLDRHNDHIDIYVVKTANGIKITDDGYTLADLQMSGFEVNTPKRKSLFNAILNGLGVKYDTESHALYVDAIPANIGQKKHYLLQAIMAVGELVNLSQESVLSLFKEDVELFLRSNEIFFSKDIKLSGKTGLDHNVDFLINQSRTKPERLIKTISNPKKETVLSSIMSFMDIDENRQVRSTNCVIYNDSDKVISNDLIAAFDSYNIYHLPWSQKESGISVFSEN